MTKAFIVSPDEGRLLDLGNFEAVVLATDDQTAGEFSLLRTQGEPPGFGPPMHVHRDAAEAFYVLEGEYLMYLEDRTERCPPGTFVYVPRGTPTTTRTTGRLQMAHVGHTAAAVSWDNGSPRPSTARAS